MTTVPKQSRWSTGIVASFVLFIAAIVVMVCIAMAQRIDLVTDGYYDQGLRYQERIDAQRHSTGGDAVRITVLPDAVRLQFPPGGGPAGKITFYRPADMSRDVVMDIAVDTAGIQAIATTALDRGLWRVKVEWHAGGLARYHEEPVLIR
jgi:nitrogen fixation protein FixH